MLVKNLHLLSRERVGKTLLLVMLGKLTIGFVIILSSDKEETVAVLIGINTGLVIDILNGVRLIVIEEHVDLGIAVENGGIVMRPAMNTTVNVNLIICRLHMNRLMVGLQLNSRLLSTHLIEQQTHRVSVTHGNGHTVRL